MVEAGQKLVHVHAAQSHIDSIVFTRDGIRKIGQRLARQNGVGKRINGGFRNLVPGKLLTRSWVDDSWKRLTTEGIEAVKVALAQGGGG